MIEQKLVEISVDELVQKVSEALKDGYRLVQIHCTTGEPFELTYSFDKDLALYNLRLHVSADTDIPSVSSVYSSAFIYENELHDLFGLKITGINIDYNGNLYKTAVPTPFRTN